MNDETPSHPEGPGANVHLERVPISHLSELRFDPKRPPSPWNVPGGYPSSGHQLAYSLEVAEQPTGEAPQSWPEPHVEADVEDDVVLGATSSVTSDSLVDSPWADAEPTRHNLIPRTMDSLRTLGRELTERGQRVRRFGSLGVGVLTQVPDRMRLMAVALPLVFDEALEISVNHGLDGYKTAALAGVAVGGSFTAWSEVIGRTLRRAIDNFPATTNRITDNHPVMVKVIQDSIEGFPSKEELQEKQPEMPEEGYDVGPYDTRKSLLGKLALGTTRGYRTGLLFGVTPHVGLAKVGRHNDRSTNSRIDATSIEAGVALGSVAATVSALVTHDAFGRAQQIKDIVSNEKLLFAVSMGLIGVSTLLNYLSRRGASGDMQDDGVDGTQRQIVGAPLGEGA